MPVAATSRPWSVPVPAVARLTGIAAPNLYAYRSGAVAAPPGAQEAVAAVLAAGPASVVVRNRLTTPVTLAASARLYRDDPLYLVRLAKELTAHATHLRTREDVAAFFLEPPPTGSRGWDALVAGVAALASRGHLPGPPAWTRAASRYGEVLWGPLEHGRRAPRAYVDTPAELRVRSVLLPASELASL